MRKFLFCIACILTLGYSKVDAATMSEVGAEIEKRIASNSLYTFSYTGSSLSFDRSMGADKFSTTFTNSGNILSYTLTPSSESLIGFAATNDEYVIQLVLDVIADLNGYEGTVAVPLEGDLAKDGITVTYKDLLDSSGNKVSSIVNNLQIDLEIYPNRENKDDDDKPQEPDPIVPDIPDVPTTNKELENLKSLIMNGVVYNELFGEDDALLMTINGNILSMKANKDDYKIDFKLDGGVLYYVPRTGISNDVLWSYSFADMFCIYMITEAIATKNGYDINTINVDEEDLNFAENGIELKTRYYEGDGFKGDILESFRISLNNLNLDKYVGNSGSSNPSNPSNPSMPTVNVREVTEDSVTLDISYDGNGICKIYRASNDSSYEFLKAMPCNGTYKDTGLNPNTQYFYKVSVGELMSNPDDTKTSNPGTLVSNPKTGYISYGLAFIIGLSIAVISYKKLKKTDIFKQL